MVETPSREGQASGTGRTPIVTIHRPPWIPTSLANYNVQSRMHTICTISPLPERHRRYLVDLLEQITSTLLAGRFDYIGERKGYRYFISLIGSPPTSEEKQFTTQLRKVLIFVHVVYLSGTRKDLEERWDDQNHTSGEMPILLRQMWRVWDRVMSSAQSWAMDDLPLTIEAMEEILPAPTRLPVQYCPSKGHPETILRCHMAILPPDMDGEIWTTVSELYRHSAVLEVEFERVVEMTFFRRPTALHDTPTQVIKLPQTIGTVVGLTREIRNAIQLLEITPWHLGHVIMVTDGADEGPGGRNHQYASLAMVDKVMDSLRLVNDEGTFPQMTEWRASEEIREQVRWVGHLGNELLLMGNGAALHPSILQQLIKKAHQDARMTISSPEVANAGEAYGAQAVLISLRQALWTSHAAGRIQVAADGLNFVPTDNIPGIPPPTRHRCLESISLGNSDPTRLLIIHPTTMTMSQCVSTLLTYLSMAIQTQIRPFIHEVVRWVAMLQTQSFREGNVYLQVLGLLSGKKTDCPYSIRKAFRGAGTRHSLTLTHLFLKAICTFAHNTRRCRSDYFIGGFLYWRSTEEILVQANTSPNPREVADAVQLRVNGSSPEDLMREGCRFDTQARCRQWIVEYARGVRDLSKAPIRQLTTATIAPSSTYQRYRGRGKVRDTDSIQAIEGWITAQIRSRAPHDMCVLTPKWVAMATHFIILITPPESDYMWHMQHCMGYGSDAQWNTSLQLLRGRIGATHTTSKRDLVHALIYSLVQYTPPTQVVDGIVALLGSYGVWGTGDTLRWGEASCYKYLLHKLRGAFHLFWHTHDAGEDMVHLPLSFTVNDLLRGHARVTGSCQYQIPREAVQRDYEAFLECSPAQAGAEGIYFTEDIVGMAINWVAKTQAAIANREGYVHERGDPRLLIGLPPRADIAPPITVLPVYGIYSPGHFHFLQKSGFLADLVIGHLHSILQNNVTYAADVPPQALVLRAPAHSGVSEGNSINIQNNSQEEHGPNHGGAR